MILKILSRLETAMNCLQNKYNTFRRFLKTSLYYRVKHRSLEMLQILYHSLMTKLSTPPETRPADKNLLGLSFPFPLTSLPFPLLSHPLRLLFIPLSSPPLAFPFLSSPLPLPSLSLEVGLSNQQGSRAAL